MAQPSPSQLTARARIEAVLRLAEPGLNLFLAAGDRLSRAVDRGDDEPVAAIRMPGEIPSLGPGRADPHR